MIRKLLFFLVFIYILCACSTSNSIQERQQTMIDLKINKDICLGRLIFPLSDDFEITGQSYQYAWKDIEQKLQSKDEFNHDIKTLHNTMHNPTNEPDKNLLSQDSILKNGDYILFYRGENAFGSLLYSYKIMSWRNGITFSMKQEAIDKNGLNDELQRNTRLLTNLRYRAPDEIPITAGFCFENGFIADDGKNYQYEEVSFNFGLKSHPGLNFYVTIRPRTLEKEPSLVSRYDNAVIPSNLKSLWKNEVKFIEKGKYNTKYIDGERVFGNLPVEDNYDPEKTGRYQSFRWETQGVYHDVLKPSVVVEFKSGDQGIENSSLSDDEAVDLFNQIVNKIRPRPAKGMPLERW